MKSGSIVLLALVVGAFAVGAAACKAPRDQDVTDLGIADLAARDLAASLVGIACGAQTCDVGSICCAADDGSQPACGTTCNQTFSFACDGPEDCAGTNETCCLTIQNANTPSHKFVGECKAKAACDPTLSPTANPIVTARCHTNADCSDYHVILSQCCYNEGRASVLFCAIPFSTDGGINTICQN